jgi:hypothetical protein
MIRGSYQDNGCGERVFVPSDPQEYDPYDDPYWGIHKPVEDHPETRNILLEYMQSEDYHRRQRAVAYILGYITNLK